MTWPESLDLLAPFLRAAHVSFAHQHDYDLSTIQLHQFFSIRYWHDTNHKNHESYVAALDDASRGTAWRMTKEQHAQDTRQNLDTKALLGSLLDLCVMNEST